MDLFDLPVEILEEILKFLNTDDLLSCALVCKRWRRAVNQDFIWKSKCLEMNFDPNLIKTSKSHKFIQYYAKDYEGSTLEPLEYWRSVYNWHCDMAASWYCANYVNYALEVTDSSVFCLDCDGDRAATGHEDATVNVWSVSSIPFHLTTIQCLLSDFPVLSIHINNNIIVAQQKKLLQVYYRQDGQQYRQYKLIDAKSFEVGENNIEQMDRIELLGNNYENWYKECLRMNDIYANKGLIYNLCGKSLLASNSNSGYLFCWNLPENEVFNSYQLHYGNITQIEYVDGDIYLTVGLDVTHLLIIDKTTDTLNILLSVPGTKRFTIENDLVLAVPMPSDNYLKRLWIWNRKADYKNPRTRDITSNHHSAFISQQRYVVYSEIGQVKVWDPNKDVLITKFTISSTIGFIKNCFSTVIMVFLNSNLWLWDWKTGTKLCCLNYSLEWVGDFRNLVWINPTMLITAGCNKQMELFSFL